MIWSAPVVAVLIRGLLAASAMLWPDKTRSRLYVSVSLTRRL